MKELSLGQRRLSVKPPPDRSHYSRCLRRWQAISSHLKPAPPLINLKSARTFFRRPRRLRNYVQLSCHAGMRWAGRLSIADTAVMTFFESEDCIGVSVGRICVAARRSSRLRLKRVRLSFAYTVAWYIAFSLVFRLRGFTAIVAEQSG